MNDWIGKQYQHNGRGPELFDCWGLLRAVYKARTGITLPQWQIVNPAPQNVTRLITAHRDAGHAIEVAVPQDMDIVMLVRRTLCFHCGLFIAGGVLHCSKVAGGSSYERLADFTALSGQVRFYRWQ